MKELSLGNGKKIWEWLILAYFSSVALRYILCIAASQNPFVMPDEALYANIARSIANGGSIALRNQPVTYTNILYPLLLSPVYSLFGAGVQFRVIQFLNCLYMNLAVFPAYGIANSITSDRKKAFCIALVSLLLPDMLLTTRIMTEAIVYPLFLWTVYLMFGKFSDTGISLNKAALTGFAAFLLTQAKSGSVSLAIIFFCILIVGWIRSKNIRELYYALIFAGVFAAFMLILHLALALGGMDFSQQTLYQTQTQAPTLDHLKKTLPGFLLYAFFIPIAFGIFPLLLPTSNLRLYETAQKKQLILLILALAFYAAGACYLFFDTETIGNYFAGRIHIRYVFMFLPVFLCFAFSPRIEGVRPNGKLLIYLGFLLAMTATVSFGALLSNRQYPVDAILLSYIIFDDPVLNWRLLSQIAAITFAAFLLVLLYRKGWGKQAKRFCTVVLLSGLLVANWLGYDLSGHNNAKTLSEDAKQGAQLLSSEPALVVPDSGIYFDNTLSVLDIAMQKAPYAVMLEDLCANLGAYGTLDSLKPLKYWTEKPVNDIPAVKKVAFASGAFSRFVLANGTEVQYTRNGFYGIVTLPQNRKLFHSALAGLKNGQPDKNTALYIYDEQLLQENTIRVYLYINCTSSVKLTLSSGQTKLNYDLKEGRQWIYGDFAVPKGSTVFTVSIRALSGSPVIETYRV